MSSLNPRQARFVDEYLVDLNITQAAVRAGYSPQTASAIGSENLRKPEIAAAVDTASEARSIRTGISQDYVLTTIKEVVERCMQRQPVLDKKGQPVMVETEDGQVAAAYTFNAKSALTGCDLLGRHLNLWKLALTDGDGRALGSGFLDKLQGYELARRMAFLLKHPEAARPALEHAP